MSIQKTLFDRLPCGGAVDAYTLTNASGASVRILTLGGMMQQLMLPDKHGKLADVICGFDTVEGYQTGGGYQGALIGRYGNRIAGGKFTLSGTEYQLNLNENGNCHLHGGSCGFDTRIWDAEPIEGEGEDRLVLTMTSEDGDEGYPGTLSVKVTYTFTDANCLSIAYEATSDKDTICNLTSHTYYNLSGYDGASVMDHLLWLNSETYDSVDDLLIPDENAPAPVKGTRFDFTVCKPIQTPLDHNFHLRGEPRERKSAAFYADPVSGRCVKVETDLPAIQIYTGCVMDGEVPFKGGVPQRKLHAIAMETQFAPNTPNRPEMPSCVLRAGEVYRSETRLKFGIMEEIK